MPGKGKKQNEQNSAALYILLEHKSGPDNTIFIQLLKYMYHAWQEDMDNKRPLRLILPLVFYHGKEKWPYPPDFHSQFKIPEALKEFHLNFKYLLFNTEKWNLEDESNDPVKHNIFLMTSLVLLKEAFKKNIESIEKIFDFWRVNHFFKNIDRKKNLLLFFINYIAYTKEITREKLDSIVEKKAVQGENIMPTLAQQWLKEGRKEGFEKGIQKGIEQGMLINERKTLIKLIQVKFGITDKEKKVINVASDIKKLEKALELVVISDNKKAVMKIITD